MRSEFVITEAALRLFGRTRCFAVFFCIFWQPRSVLSLYLLRHFVGRREDLLLLCSVCLFRCAPDLFFCYFVTGYLAPRGRRRKKKCAGRNQPSGCTCTFTSAPSSDSLTRCCWEIEKKVDGGGEREKRHKQIPPKKEENLFSSDAELSVLLTFSSLRLDRIFFRKDFPSWLAGRRSLLLAWPWLCSPQCRMPKLKVR